MSSYTNDDNHKHLLESVVSLMASVLKKNSVNPNSNFFDLGGSSIDLLRFISLLYNNLNLSIGPAELFINPSPLGVLEFGVFSTEFEFEKPAASPERSSARDPYKYLSLDNVSRQEGDLLPLILMEEIAFPHSAIITTFDSSSLAEISPALTTPFVNSVIVTPTGVLSQIVLPLDSNLNLIEAQPLLERALKITQSLNIEYVLCPNFPHLNSVASDFNIMFIPPEFLKSVTSIIENAGGAISALSFPVESHFYFRYPKLVSNGLLENETGAKIHLMPEEAALLAYPLFYKDSDGTSVNMESYKLLEFLRNNKLAI